LKQTSDGQISDEGIQKEVSDFIIYPNPNKGNFTIDMKDNNILGFDVDIINTSGAIVYSKKAYSGFLEVNV
jgi:hypothetical protein